MNPNPFSVNNYFRFFAKVEPAFAPPGIEHDCWLWTACTDQDGYGQFHCPGFPDQSSKTVRAHRWCTAFWYGVDRLKGLTFDHLCFRKNCVNPRHGSAISHSANVARGNALRHVDPEHGLLEEWGFKS